MLRRIESAAEATKQSQIAPSERRRYLDSLVAVSEEERLYASQEASIQRKRNKVATVARQAKVHEGVPVST